MKTFKDFMAESRRSSAEAGMDKAYKEMERIRDLREKGVTADDLHAEADKHAAAHKAHMDEIRSKIDSDPKYFRSKAHLSTLRKANTAMSKEQNLRNRAAALK